MLRKIQIMSYALGALMLFCCSPEGTAAGSSPVKASSSSDTTVKGAERSAEGQLRAMGEAIHHFKTAAAELASECERENDFAGGEIDFIGTDVIPILPSTAEGFGPASYIPPRKKYVDFHMAQLNALLPILQDDLDNMPSINLQDKTNQAPDITQAQAYLKDVRKHLQNLQPLTAGPPYDAAQIINEATAIHQAVSQIDKLRKDIYSVIKTDAKTSAK